MTNTLEEYQAKLQFYYKKIDEINEKITKKLNNNQLTNKQASWLKNGLDGFEGDITGRIV